MSYWKTSELTQSSLFNVQIYISPPLQLAALTERICAFVEYVENLLKRRWKPHGTRVGDILNICKKGIPPADAKSFTPSPHFQKIL